MIFGKRPQPPDGSNHPDSQTAYGSSQMSGEGLEREYEDIVRAQLSRLGVPQDTVEVEVRPAGAMQDGRNIYLGMVRLVKWEARTSLRLLVALPLLEAKTRQSLDTTWLADVSHFGGLWVHASAALRSNEVLSDIREVVMQLERNMPDTNKAAPPDTGWSASVQAELGPR